MSACKHHAWCFGTLHHVVDRKTIKACHSCGNGECERRRLLKCSITDVVLVMRDMYGQQVLSTGQEKAEGKVDRSAAKKKIQNFRLHREEVEASFP